MKAIFLLAASARAASSARRRIFPRARHLIGGTPSQVNSKLHIIITYRIVKG